MSNKLKIHSLIIIVMMSACSFPEKNKAISTDETKIDSLISLLTLEEKVTLIHSESSFTSGGVPRLGIPHWVMSDGPHGVRKEQGTDYVADENGLDSATYLPVGVTLASTWNPELGYAYGTVLGSEAKFRGKDVILGPGINIMRTPLNGRNFEYLSEDPYLISKMVVGYIKGVQDQEISSCVKHFAVNNQEIERNSISVEVSERALREIYLPGFKAAVQDGQVNTLMGAYNKLRGQFATENAYLMNTILKGEWGFQGAVISDWNATHNTMEAINNGLDEEMGTDLSMQPKPDYGKYFMGDTVVKLVKAGTVDVKLIDDKVRRVLRQMYKTKMFSKRTPGAFNTPEHQATALKVAEEGIVLLKNDKVLPINKEKIKTIAVIGANGNRKHAGSGGSSQVNAKYEITPLAGIEKITGGKVKITYSPGYEISRTAKANPKLIEEAVKAAANADLVIYVGGWIHGYSDQWNDNAFDSESVDKPDIILPFGQEQLLAAVQKVNPNNIVVLFSGSGADMTNWGDKTKAIIQAWYPGMEGGNALAKIIFGEINPSGKLPVTFAKKLEDVPAHKLGEYPGKNGVVNYNEGIFVGYRYYDTKKVEPLYPFGFGLSYTTFDFASLLVEKGSEHQASVKLTIKNTGAVAGAEVVQVYVKDEVSSLERPDKELKGFSKVFLQPGESKQIELTLNEDAFQYYDDTKKAWVFEPGKFTILVGNSSRNILLTSDVTF